MSGCSMLTRPLRMFVGHWTAPRPLRMHRPRHAEGIQLQVLRKDPDRWLIASFQNTNSVPETPFPKGPRAESEPVTS